MEWDVYSTWKLQLQIRFNLFWKLWLYLCSRKWLRPTRSLVVSLKFNSSMVFTVKNAHCLKGVRIWSYSGPHFSSFSRFRTEYREILSLYSVRMRENAGKIRTRITPNTDTFYAVTIRGRSDDFQDTVFKTLKFPNSTPSSF